MVAHCTARRAHHAALARPARLFFRRHIYRAWWQTVDAFDIVSLGGNNEIACILGPVGSLDYQHDAWGVDVTIAGSQKGLMLPPGLCFNAVSEKAMAASEKARLPRSYWNWQAMLPSVENGSFPYTPATNLLFGLQEALAMMHEEGLEQVQARHARHAEATRRAVAAWGLENYCLAPEEYSNTVTTVVLPEDVDGDALRALILERFDMSLGTGLGKLKGNVFRIGHLGDFNDLMLAGTLCGVEMGFQAAGTPHESGGVAAAMHYLSTGGM